MLKRHFWTRFLKKASGTGIADLTISGDFNFPWIANYCRQTNPYITRPSTTDTLSSGNILDLVFTNHESLIEGTTVHPKGFDSDHVPVCFTIKKKFNRPKNSQISLPI